MKIPRGHRNVEH